MNDGLSTTILCVVVIYLITKDIVNKVEATPAQTVCEARHE